MKLTFQCRSRSLSCDWKTFALLRDNVQHYIEHGIPSERFSALHAIEEAVDTGQKLLDAATLRGEVLQAWYALWKVPLEDAAVSLRTRAILTRCPDRPAVRCTIRAREVGWDLPIAAAAASPVARAASPFVEAVLAVTETAGDGDELEVRCH